MAEVRNDLYYTPTHEWVDVQDNVATCGIDDFAQAETGEIVFVELPEVGTEVEAGDDVCVIESVKSASDVYTPVSGKIIAVNEALESNPGQVNEDCYESGWLFKIELSNIDELNALLSAEAYQAKIAEDDEV